MSAEKAPSISKRKRHAMSSSEDGASVTEYGSYEDDEDAAGLKPSSSNSASAASPSLFAAAPKLDIFSLVRKHLPTAVGGERVVEEGPGDKECGAVDVNDKEENGDDYGYSAAAKNEASLSRRGDTFFFPLDVAPDVQCSEMTGLCYVSSVEAALLSDVTRNPAIQPSASPYADASMELSNQEVVVVEEEEEEKEEGGGRDTDFPAASLSLTTASTSASLLASFGPSSLLTERLRLLREAAAATAAAHTATLEVSSVGGATLPPHSNSNSSSSSSNSSGLSLPRYRCLVCDERFPEKPPLVVHVQAHKATMPREATASLQKMRDWYEASQKKGRVEKL